MINLKKIAIRSIINFEFHNTDFAKIMHSKTIKICRPRLLYICYTSMQFSYRMYWYSKMLGRNVLKLSVLGYEIRDAKRGGAKCKGAKCGAQNFWAQRGGGGAQSVGCIVWGTKCVEWKVKGPKVIKSSALDVKTWSIKVL